MIDFLYSWIRHRRLLEFHDYTRAREAQRLLVLQNKEEYEANNASKDLRTIIASANLYATYLYEDKNYELAIKVSNEILDFCKKKLAKAQDIKHEMVNAYFNLGDSYYQIGESKQANKYYKKVIKFVNDDEKYMATKQGQMDVYDAYISAVSAYHLDNDTPSDLENIHNLLMEAHKVALDAIEFYSDEISKRYLMMSYLRLGNFYFAKGSILQSLTLYVQARDLALEIFDTTNDELDHINLLYCDIAPVEVYLSKGKYESALPILELAMERIDRMLNEHMLIPLITLQLRCLAYKQEISKQLKEHEEEVKYALCGKLLAREAKNKWAVPELMVSYAKALYRYALTIENDNPDKAISDLEKSVSYIKPYLTKDRTHINFAYRHILIELAYLYGEKKDALKARDLMNESLNITRSYIVKDPYNITYKVWLLDGLVFYNKYNVMLPKEQVNQDVIDEILRLLNSKDIFFGPRKYSEVYLSLSAAFQAVNKYDEAIRYINLAIDYLDKHPFENETDYLNELIYCYKKIMEIGKETKNQQLINLAIEKQTDLIDRYGELLESNRAIKAKEIIG